MYLIFRSLFYNINLHQKEPEFLGEMVNFMPEEGNMQDDPGIAPVSESKVLKKKEQHNDRGISNVALEPSKTAPNG